VKNRKENLKKREKICFREKKRALARYFRVIAFKKLTLTFFDFDFSGKTAYNIGTIERKE